MKRNPVDRIINFFEWVIFFGALFGLIGIGLFMLNAKPTMTKDQENFLRWLSN